MPAKRITFKRQPSGVVTRRRRTTYRTMPYSARRIASTANVSRQPMRQTGPLSIVPSPWIQRERYARFCYSDTYSMTSVAAGSPGIQTFRLNSLFDFDFTGTGHQPMFYDQASAMYQFYRVLECTVHYEWYTNNTNPVNVSAMTYNFTPATIQNEIVEFSRRPQRALTVYQKVKGVFHCKIPEVLGLESADYNNNSLYNIAFGSNPLTPNIAFLEFAAFIGTATTTAAFLNIFADFKVVLSTPLDPGLS